MSIQINQMTDEFSTAPQIGVEDVAELVRLGFKTIINNRPDYEGGVGQPVSESIRDAAEKFGLNYFYIPVIPNKIEAEQIEAFSAAYAIAHKPVLAFCRTGNRAANIFTLSQSVA